LICNKLNNNIGNINNNTNNNTDDNINDKLNKLEQTNTSLLMKINFMQQNIKSENTKETILY